MDLVHKFQCAAIRISLDAGNSQQHSLIFHLLKHDTRPYVPTYRKHNTRPSSPLTESITLGHTTPLTESITQDPRPHIQKA